MKRLFAFALILSLLLSGCSLVNSREIDVVTFYYLQSEYRYGTETGVIAGEKRDSTGHRDSISYMMAMYLMGPASEDLVSPLPPGTRIHKSEIQNGEVRLYLSKNADALSPEDFSVACACLTLTCLDITDADTVTVICENRSITMNRESLTLYDDGIAAETMEETK